MNIPVCSALLRRQLMTDPTIKVGGKNTVLHHLFINIKSTNNKQEELKRLMNKKKWIMAGIAGGRWNGS